MAGRSEAEWRHIAHVLAETGGNRSAAARLLGLHRQSLQRILREHEHTLGTPLAGCSDPAGEVMPLADFRDRALARAVASLGGVRAAARGLGVARSTVQRRLRAMRPQIAALADLPPVATLPPG